MNGSNNTCVVEEVRKASFVQSSAHDRRQTDQAASIPAPLMRCKLYCNKTKSTRDEHASSSNRKPNPSHHTHACLGILTPRDSSVATSSASAPPSPPAASSVSSSRPPTSSLATFVIVVDDGVELSVPDASAKTKEEEEVETTTLRAMKARKAELRRMVGYVTGNEPTRNNRVKSADDQFLSIDRQVRSNRRQMMRAAAANLLRSKIYHCAMQRRREKRSDASIQCKMKCMERECMIGYREGSTREHASGNV